MLNRIKISLQNHRNIIRITRYILLSLVLLLVSWIFDYKYPSLKENVPDIMLLSSEVTSSFLSNLSGTFLTVTTFTFTTILTVLGKYSSSFTPRIVQDFIDKPNVLSLFGIYIGGFFYTVLALFMIQNIEFDVPLLCGTIGVFYAIAAMVAFILFVLRVLSDIKMSNVIDNISNKAYSLIQEEAKRRKESERIKPEEYVDEFKIYANDTGYFYDIDSDKLMEYLDGIRCELVIDKKIGQYFAQGTYIARLHTFEKLDMDKGEIEEILGKLSSCLLINVSKNDYKDYHHEITNLVEIAMTALSPGINDPNSAIEVIKKISFLLGKLFSTTSFYVSLGEDDNCKIIYNGYSVEEELNNAFLQIIFYGKEDPMVSREILNGIYMIYMLSDGSVKNHIRDFMEEVYEICRENMNTEMNKKQLDMVYEDFKRNKDKQLDEEKMKEEDKE